MNEIDYSEEDNYLQKCFWSHFEKSDLFGIAKKENWKKIFWKIIKIFF